MAAHARATRAEADLETEKHAMEQARFHIILNARAENVGTSQACMVSKLHAMEQALSASRKGLDSQLQQAFEATQMELDDVRESAARVRFHVIRNARAETVGTSQSCMVSKSQGKAAAVRRAAAAEKEASAALRRAQELEAELAKRAGVGDPLRLRKEVLRASKL